MRAIAFSLIKALLVTASGAFTLISFQSSTTIAILPLGIYHVKIIISLTYIIFSNIVAVWLSYRHGIGGFLSASDANISGYLARKKRLLKSVQSVRVLIGKHPLK